MWARIFVLARSFPIRRSALQSFVSSTRGVASFGGPLNGNESAPRGATCPRSDQGSHRHGATRPGGWRARQDSNIARKYKHYNLFSVFEVSDIPRTLPQRRTALPWPVVRQTVRRQRGSSPIRTSSDRRSVMARSKRDSAPSPWKECWPPRSPARATPRRSPAGPLLLGARGAGRSPSRLRRAAGGAGLLLGSFAQLITVDRGYDPAKVVAPGPEPRRGPVGSNNMTRQSMAERRAVGRRFQESLVEEMSQDGGAAGCRCGGGLVTPAAGVGRRGQRNHAPRGRRPDAGRPGAVSPRPRSTPSARSTSTRCGFGLHRFDRGGESTCAGGQRDAVPLSVRRRAGCGATPAAGRCRPRTLERRSGSWAIVRYDGLTITESLSEAYMPLHPDRSSQGGAGRNGFRIGGHGTDGRRSVSCGSAPSGAGGRGEPKRQHRRRDRRWVRDCRQRSRSAASKQSSSGSSPLWRHSWRLRHLRSAQLHGLATPREIGVRMAQIPAWRCRRLVVRRGAALAAAGTLFGVLPSRVPSGSPTASRSGSPRTARTLVGLGNEPHQSVRPWDRGVARGLWANDRRDRQGGCVVRVGRRVLRRSRTTWAVCRLAPIRPRDPAPSRSERRTTGDD